MGGEERGVEGDSCKDPTDVKKKPGPQTFVFFFRPTGIRVQRSSPFHQHQLATAVCGGRVEIWGLLKHMGRGRARRVEGS